jgi:transcriptional regulator with XRE-family HTH domain
LSGEWFATVTNKIAMAANNRLKAARVLQGMTQLQLAEKVGVKEIHVSRIETGRSTPDTEMKQRIAEVLQRPTFELFDC